MRETLVRLWDQLAWAAERLEVRLEEIAREEGEAPVEARRLLAHLVYAERIWLDRIADGTTDQPVWPTTDELPPLGAIRALQRETLRDAWALLSDEGLEVDRWVSYLNSSGTRFETRLGDILLHVALHGAYHRGQVARALRQGGWEPVNTDFITWVRAGSPRPSRGG